MEEKFTLVRKEADTGLTLDERASLQRIKTDLSQINPRLLINAEKRGAFYKKWIDGPWTLKYMTRPFEERWKIHQVLCQRRLGCCARECGCCETPR